MTKLKCIWNKYADNRTMKVTSKSGIYNDGIYTIIYHSDSYLLLFGNKK